MNRVARQVIPKALCGLGLSLFFLVLAWATELDLALARRAFVYSEPHWPQGDAQPWVFLYRFGEWPGAAAAMLSALVTLLSYLRPQWRPYRGPALFFFVCFVLGPGLLVNTLGKGLTGRPRPLQVSTFMGFWEFHRPFELGIPGRGQSFLSGHASMGFLWMAGFFMLRGSRRWLALAGGAAYGLLMGWGRVLQGGHFLSDILLCGTFLFTLMALLSPLVEHPPSLPFFFRGRTLAALGLASAAWLVIGKAVYEERRYTPQAAGTPRRPANAMDRVVNVPPFPQGMKLIDIDVHLDQGDLDVVFTRNVVSPSSVSFRETFWGMGLPGAKVDLSAVLQKPVPGILSMLFSQTIRGRWWHQEGKYAFWLPALASADLRLRLAHGKVRLLGLPEDRRVLLSGLPPGQGPPRGFHAFSQDSWVRDGALPLISIDVSASEFTIQ